MPTHRAVVSSEGCRHCVTSLPSLSALDPDRLLSTIYCSELVCVVPVPSLALLAGYFLSFWYVIFTVNLLSGQES